MRQPAVASRPKGQKGFTIVELMVSTVVFTLMLLAAMVALIQITRLYYRGIHFAQTQEVARGTMEEITQAIQFTSDKIVPPAAGSPTGPRIDSGDVHTGFFCVGSKMYAYAIDRKVTTNSPQEANKEKKHALWVSDDGCLSATPTPPSLDADVPTANGRELLRENMRITNLTISNTDSLYTVSLAIAYGDDDLLVDSADGSRRVCESGGFGVEFCAISELTSTVLKRL